MCGSISRYKDSRDLSSGSVRTEIIRPVLTDTDRRIRLNSIVKLYPDAH